MRCCLCELRAHVDIRLCCIVWSCKRTILQPRVRVAPPAMATIWLLLSAYLPTAPGTCRISQCRDLTQFVNCTVDDATSCVSKTVVLGHCSDFFAMKFVVMSQLWSPEPLLYSFSVLRDRLSLHSADRPSWWALQQLKRVQSYDKVIVQSPRARETERRLAAQAAKAPLAFGIQMPRVDCTICVDLVKPV